MVTKTTGAIGHFARERGRACLRHGAQYACGAIGAKLSRRGFDNKKVKLQTLKAGETVQIGPFKVHTFHVSSPFRSGTASGLGIESPAGLVYRRL